ncbi:Hypothetical protein R9X50_00410600 [Acrodontium crateriforme]|uniref:Uncharacterized protein n=1 Tax=Acrodontium crateriforme TaxID=150365 RepID=A0AAQ3M6Y6_9PEZI|nr:Hypothetical protein R9X50_00410600 [Acrodontium crateriforme]
MGVDSRRPPLPAPTESMDETDGNDTEVATNLTTRTEKTSYSIPEDGTPITISTHKTAGGHHHSRQKSQTSLLIEYFESSKSGDKTRSRPSVRVKVTPSSTKRSKHGAHDAIQITGIGQDRKPSYTRRISLGNKQSEPVPIESTELSHSSGSNVSGRPPVEIEFLDHNASDVSNARSSRGLRYAQIESNISSMPAESMLDGSMLAESELSRGVDQDDYATDTQKDHLSAPIRTRSRSRSQDRITQKVMEKLGQTGKTRKSSRSEKERALVEDYDNEGYAIKPRRRRGLKHDDDGISTVESSLLSSNPAASQRSYRSNTSQGSRMTNNPKLLEMVEDTIKRMILPEINAIKEDQKTDRNYRSFKDARQGSYDSQSLERKLSKSSSTPNISTKPKVVLNRDGDDPGTVLSRGDSERRKIRKSSREEYHERPSSRRSSSKHSYQGDGYDDEEHASRKSEKSSHKLRDAAAAGLVGSALTAAALHHHDSRDEVQSRRKKRSKSRGSRSRSVSMTETAEEVYKTKENIPPMPLASHINDSDVTRESIVSSGTEMPETYGTVEPPLPVQEVSRGSLGALSPVQTHTPSRSRSPAFRDLNTSNGHLSQGSPKSPASTKERMAALAAAGMGGFAAAKGYDALRNRHVDVDGYGSPISPRNVASPTQSISSMKKQFEDDDALVPRGLRPKSALSRSSAIKLHSQPASLRSAGSSPINTHSPRGLKTVDGVASPLDGPDAAFLRQSTATPGTPGTPNNEAIDDWYERQHRINDRYRDSFGERATNRDSYQTNPFPEDDRRFASYGDSVQEYAGAEITRDKDNQVFESKPQYVHDSFGAESNVASLMDPSMLSASMVSGQESPDRNKAGGTYANRMAEHIRDMEQQSPALYEGSTLSQTGTSQDRWAALKGHARNLSASTGKNSGDGLNTPSRSPIKNLRNQDSIEPLMGASGLPLANDPLPEIGHFNDSKSDLTERSVVHGPLSGDVTGKSTWPYTPEPHGKSVTPEDKAPGIDFDKEKGLVAAAAGGLAARAAARAANQTNPEEGHVQPFERSGDNGRTNVPSPVAFRDEGYVTDNHGRSAEVISPHPEEQRYSPEDIAEYERAMNALDLGPDDPFIENATHKRHVSGNSHGMVSPLYDSSTGKGLDRIQSQDIVALMDHLTVRDAQRNARDTEILVTLVRSAAEMRQSFDEMRRFIAEQDRLIMQNSDRDAEQVAQKVLGGPRAQPTAGSRTPKGSSVEDVQTKRKNVLRRALKSLTGGKKADDLARVEDMLMQILDNVEDLKHYGVSGQQLKSYTNASLDSYAKLRTGPDSGYEPEGEADTPSSPDHSGQLSTTPRGAKDQYHSGYDGRRGSVNRVSTVAEGDEDDEEADLTADEHLVLSHQFENNENLLTPTQEVQRQLGLSPQQELTPKAAEKQRKHKSNSSSIFGVPKISRWSKTTSSSAAPDVAALESPDFARGARPLSGASQSGSHLDKYDDDDDYKLHDDDRLQSPQGLSREQQRPISQSEVRSMHSQGSRFTRTPSPLIPSEASLKHHDDYDRYGDEPEPSPVHEEDLDFDDPKYQAHRNSLLLQHPQPVQGTTGRHQNNLETQAQGYDPKSPTASDVSQRSVSDFDPSMWGSAGTAALARKRFSDPVSTGAYSERRGSKDDPLVPRKPVDHSVQYDDDDDRSTDEEYDLGPEYSNSGFSKGGANYYSSPYGSGHLLEPIEERYSLEVDSRSDGRHSLSPEPRYAKTAAEARTPQRKITGPRPMGSKSPAPHALDTGTGTVRRKAVAAGRDSQDSLHSESF